MKVPVITDAERMRLYRRKIRQKLNKPFGKPLPKGYLHKGQLQVGISFPSDMFEDVKKFAKKSKSSFNESVRTLVEWGFMSIKGDV